jgi:HrpA-like RNA helicase
MSATINHETFVKYFDGAPLVTISGFAHPITDRFAICTYHFGGKITNSPLHRVLRYLEDFMPLIRYQTTSPKSRKQSNAVPQAFCDELKSQGLDDSSITAIHNVVRADRVDFKVSSTY